MDADDENISTLMAMGFPDINEITRALRLAKNDLNEAVAILTNDQSVALYGPDFGVDVDMKDSQKESKDENTASDSVEVNISKYLLLSLNKHPFLERKLRPVS